MFRCVKRSALVADSKIKPIFHGNRLPLIGSIKNPSASHTAHWSDPNSRHKRPHRLQWGSLRRKNYFDGLDVICCGHGYLKALRPEGVPPPVEALPDSAQALRDSPDCSLASQLLWKCVTSPPVSHRLSEDPALTRWRCQLSQFRTFLQRQLSLGSARRSRDLMNSC